MDYMRLAKWTAIIVLALYLVTTPVLTIALPIRVTGTVYDNGPQGFTKLVSMLKSHGHHVYLTLPDPNTTRDAVLLVLDPVYCTPGILGRLDDWLSRLASHGALREILVVGETSCAATLASRYMGVSLDAFTVTRGVLTIDGLQVSTVTIMLVRPAPGLIPIGGVAGVEYPAAVKRGPVILIGDSDFLRNSMVDEERVALIESLAGCEAGCSIVIPAVLETGEVSAYIPVYPLVLYALGIAARIEQSLFANPYTLPLVVLAYTLLASIVLYRVLVERLVVEVDKLYRRPSPPAVVGATSVYGLVAERGLRALEAKSFIGSLYEFTDFVLRSRFGVSVPEALEDSGVRSAIASAGGIDEALLQAYLQRLYTLYRRMHRETWRPLIVLWGREAKRLARMASEVFKNMGVSLEKLQATGSGHVESIQGQGVRG